MILLGEYIIFTSNGLNQIYNERTLEFMENVIRISGIGDPQGFLPDGATLQSILCPKNTRDCLHAWTTTSHPTELAPVTADV